MKPAADGLDQIGRQVGEITQGLVFHLATLAKRAAQQVSLVDATVVDAFRRGYMHCTGSL